jgi:SAM-dependent methyltransferase
MPRRAGAGSHGVFEAPPVKRTDRSAQSRFLERQEQFFAEADTGHFFWQTGNPYFARTERALLEGLPLGGGQAVLEVGCGEGGNLANVLSGRSPHPRLVVGVDLFERKLGFARRQGIPARFVCADALALPFREGVFDVVLCRDLLHHLEEREPAVAELRRVARPGAAVWVVEPNGRNPLIRLLAFIRPHERGQLRNSPGTLRALLAPHFTGIDVELRQPMPLYRVVLHYQFGFPRLGASRLAGRLLDAAETLFRAAVPRRWWAYIVARCAPEGPARRGP